MKRITVLHLCLIACFSAFAQAGWNWPENPDQDKLAKEKQAYYKIQMQTDKWDGALHTLSWLYQNTPDLHESIYQDGAKIIDNLLDTELPAERQANLEDSLLWMYDMRIKYFGDKDGSVLDRKVYTAFKLYYKSPAKYPMLLGLYKELFSKDPQSISDFNLTPYMTLATYYHKSNPDQFTMENVLDVHSQISSVIDAKMATGDKDKLQKEQDKIDAFLGSIDGGLTCEFIEMQLLPKFEANPNDVSTAKKIFSYSLKAKCTDKPYFVKAGEVLLKSDPTYSLAINLGDKFYSIDSYEKAAQMYKEAETLATNNDDKFEALIGQANTQSKLGAKSKARSIAYQALSIKPGAPEAYNLIGNLYFLSYQSCKGGESIVKDRAVFLAAYDMYQKAGNNQQMNASKEQFPSIEEIFNEGMKEGQQITVGCWINETVELRRR